MANKVEVMLELERRGALPPDKQAILTELRNRGAIPPSEDVGPGAGAQARQADEAVARKNGMGWFLDDTTPRQRVDLSTPRQSVPEPSFGQISSMLSSSPTGQGTGTGGKVVPPTDWAAEGRNLVHHLPEMTGAAVGAGALALAPETAGASLLAYPLLGGMLGYQAGRPVRGAVEAATGMPQSDEGGLQIPEMATTGMTTAMGGMPEAGAETTRLAGKGLEYGVKGAKALARGVAGRQPQKFVSKMTGLAPNAPEVTTALQEGIPLTGAKAQETGLNLRDKIWAPVQQLIDESAASGNTISRSALMSRITPVLEKIKQHAPGMEQSPAYQKALQEASLLQQYPENIRVQQAEGIKQYVNKMVRDWESSLGADIATKPAAGVAKAFKSGIPEAIGETTTNPEAYSAGNLRYGNLAKLLESGGLEKADVAASKAGPLQGARNWLGEKSARMTYPMQQWGQSPTATISTNPLEEMIYGAYGKPRPGFSPETQREMMAKPNYTAGPARLNIQQATMPNATETADIYAQQLAPNIPVAEETPGTLLEGQVPQRGFTFPEGYGNIPRQPSQVVRTPEPNYPAQMSEFTPQEGTLLEGQVMPWSGAKPATTGRGSLEQTIQGMSKEERDALVNAYLRLQQQQPKTQTSSFEELPKLFGQ